MNTNSPLTAECYAKRRERVFTLLAGLFLGTLGIINILGISRFIDLSFTFANLDIPMIIPIGVLPYPITFLCTDIISEFYGKERANNVVWVGLLVNIWILFIIWIAGFLPPKVAFDPITALPAPSHPDYAFFRIRNFTTGCVIGSMLAYLAAQLLDVHLFHFWKKVTKGKHLWLRNNASTLISQLLDTTIVILATYYFTDGLPLTPESSVFSQITALILCCYCFKAACALLDTIPFYLAVYSLCHYFGINIKNINEKPLSFQSAMAASS
ncbi:MAG: queuosine precursor transporter [Candidatus Berkiella sp.]